MAYEDIYGRVEEELHTRMAPDVERLAARLGVTAKEMLDKLKDNYDGNPLFKMMIQS